MIAFDKVTKKFALGNIALDDVSFEVQKNEFVFLVGPSGAGKTTILRLLLHQFLPTSGSVTVDEVDIGSKKFHNVQELRRRIGVVFQDFKILPEKNLFENIALGMSVTHAPVSQIKDEVYKALELVNLKGRELLFPLQMSAGELQRVAIARAIIGDRDILLADEPTGNLDPKTTWEIMRILKKLEKKKTMLIATHNTDIVNSLRKRVLVISKGKLERDIPRGGYEL
ncbi:ATP-binding cassette domain-containing protein [Candidatus Roizmanbacteria bacterium]|nr:ATP-binding cassette domain-containing protein [Candidatus Roizmanbacteria bacterium]